MRWGPWVVLCLLASLMAAGSGCRKPMTPNIDRNEAPETWITAAPLDTLTTINEDTRRPDPETGPSISTIPVRFHLYWAASDRDGAIAGFYYAVVETTAAPLEGGIFAPLPGPKPQDYHFTTKTDTTFIFTVSEMFTDRRHAFYIYAVDNNGKADPTPARFIFNAIDKFPPRAEFTLAQATGPYVSLTYDGDPVPQVGTWAITDTLNPRTDTRDTVAATSDIDFAWRPVITLAGSAVLSYKYKMDETQFQFADSSVRAVTYRQPISPGLKVFTLRALDQANGAGQVTRRFYMDFAPDTWWAGPDPDMFPPLDASGRGVDGEAGSRCVTITPDSWIQAGTPGYSTGGCYFRTVESPNPFIGTGSTYGPDSMLYRPSKRYPPHHDFSSKEARTFYEIYNGRIYARTEGDTVHMNSQVVLWNGGYDKDSRYDVQADKDDPDLPGGYASGPVVQDAGLVGSPIGFRANFVNEVTPRGLMVRYAQSPTYPVYLPGSVYRSIRLGAHLRAIQAGKVYALVRAEDADGTLDTDIPDAQQWEWAADSFKTIPQNQMSLRRKVLVFYVDKAPALVRNDPTFIPTEGQTFDQAQWQFHLVGMDLDPYNTAAGSPNIGVPSARPVIRFGVSLKGKSLFSGQDTVWVYNSFPNQPWVMPLGSPVDLTFIPGGGGPCDSPFQSGPIQVSIQVCDCDQCSSTPGQGRCVDGIDPETWQVVHPENVITVNYVRPAICGTAAGTSSTSGRPGPGPSGRGE